VTKLGAHGPIDIAITKLELMLGSTTMIVLATKTCHREDSPYFLTLTSRSYRSERMASSIPLQVAETVQTAHINRRPSARHDINPSTAASQKEPVVLEEKGSLDGNGGDGIDDVEDDIPYSVLRPKRRRSTMPPLPDLRFEQSYLHSISGATTWGRVAWITLRDQVRLHVSQQSITE
jgi:hypothetical protein